ncbi:hypothetical protein CF394_08510 [Tetzosporium hominis]|uniref:Uncharacterized protein n=1 Tax=Tetzosporium hominis TaxID=2020506 RepID=A0A264W433_9BACL|nr:hypothetical protein [Tetzosporium hominis]OZS77787.1 hypothetical protein CF394_08510 [Tetzosporium hominis]
MENELKSLKAAMDATVFKDADFDSSNKQGVRKALYKKKRRSFSLAPLVAVAALFLVVLIGMSAVLQNEQSAAPEPPPETHIFEGMIFQGQTNSGDSLQFIDGNLTIFTDPMMSAVRPWTDPDDASSEQANETTYSKITVVREDSLFSVYSDGNLVFTLTQTAPRMFEDSSGNVYVTNQYIEEADSLTARVEDFDLGFNIDGGQIFGNNVNGIVIYMGNLGMRNGNLSVLDEFLLEKGYNSTDSIYLEFPKAQIVVEGSMYTVHLNDEESLEFEKVGKRIIKDANGREYYSNDTLE